MPICTKCFGPGGMPPFARVYPQCTPSPLSDGIQAPAPAVLLGSSPNSRFLLYICISTWPRPGNSKKRRGTAPIAAQMAQKSAIFRGCMLPSNIDGSCHRHRARVLGLDYDVIRCHQASMTHFGRFFQKKCAVREFSRDWCWAHFWLNLDNSWSAV